MLLEGGAPAQEQRADGQVHGHEGGHHEWSLTCKDNVNTVLNVSVESDKSSYLAVMPFEKPRQEQPPQ